MKFPINKLIGLVNSNICMYGNWLAFDFDFCFTALQHILGHFGRGQLT